MTLSGTISVQSQELEATQPQMKSGVAEPTSSEVLTCSCSPACTASGTCPEDLLAAQAQRR